MKRRLKFNRLFLIVGLVVASVLILRIADSFLNPKESVLPCSASGDAAIPADAKDYSLITEPQDGMAPVLSMIEDARQSIDLTIYELGDPNIETALIDAERRGISVRVILDHGYDGKPVAMNQEAYNLFHADGVLVRFSSDKFVLTHEKALVIDGKTALIATFNFVPKYYPTSRDFGVVDKGACDVAAIESVFNADWQGSAITPDAGDGGALVWSPGSRTALLALITGAQKSLDIYNEEMSDAGIMDALAEAARRGVRVRVVMTYADEWENVFHELASADVQIRTYPANANMYIHAKAIVADGKEVFIGSENFSKTSLDENRELGIILSDGSTIQSIETTFESDWQGAGSK